MMAFYFFYAMFCGINLQITSQIESNTQIRQNKSYQHEYSVCKHQPFEYFNDQPFTKYDFSTIWRNLTNFRKCTKVVDDIVSITFSQLPRCLDLTFNLLFSNDAVSGGATEGTRRTCSSQKSVKFSKKNDI